MLQKIMLILFMTSSLNNCFSQSNFKYAYPIKIDYKTGIIKLDTSKNGLPKALNVGQILQISIYNLPEKFSVNAVTVFENDKMESANIFNGFVNTGLQTKAENKNAEVPDTEKKSATEKEKEQKIKEQKNEIYKDSITKIFTKDKFAKNDKLINVTKTRADFTNSNENKAVINKEYKTNIDDLQNSMRLSDVKNYLDALLIRSKKGEIDSLKIIGNNASLKKAEIDLKYQQKYLLKYAQQNIDDRKKINDGVRVEYAQRIDSLQNVLNTYLPIPKNIDKYLLGVQVLNRDYTNITIEIKDSDNKVVNVLPLSFNNHKGFKIDFSTGVFNTFRKTYSYNILNATTTLSGVTTANDSNYKIKELNNGNNNLSIGILLHGYWRHFNYANFGPALGFSYSLESKELNLLLGGSLLLGKEQRFVINAGFAFSKTKELTLYNTLDTYHKSVLNTSTDLKLSSRVSSSPFIGVTYNLGSIKTKTETRILN